MTTDGDYHAMVADTGECVVDLDAPWGADYLAAIRRVSAAPVSYVVYPHSNRDHICGAGCLRAPVAVARRATRDPGQARRPAQVAVVVAIVVLLLVKRPRHS